MRKMKRKQETRAEMKEEEGRSDKGGNDEERRR